MLRSPLACSGLHALKVLRLIRLFWPSFLKFTSAAKSCHVYEFGGVVFPNWLLLFLSSGGCIVLLAHPPSVFAPSHIVKCAVLIRLYAWSVGALVSLSVFLFSPQAPPGLLFGPLPFCWLCILGGILFSFSVFPFIRIRHRSSDPCCFVLFFDFFLRLDGCGTFC